MALEQDEHIKRLMEGAFEKAFQEQIAHLFKVYVGNAPSVAEQRKYTATGINNAIAAYRLAMSAVDDWKS